MTFLQVDPLFTLDLTDPARPAVSGELKIPGYSSYIQPLREHRLIGIGRDGAALQVALFDVSNPRSPAPVAMHRFPGEGSEAEGEHLAFHVSPDGRRLALPVTLGCNVTACPAGGGVRLFEIEQPAGVITTDFRPKALYLLRDSESVRRVIFLNDLLYLVNSRSLHVVDELNPGNPLLTVSLPLDAQSGSRWEF